MNNDTAITIKSIPRDQRIKCIKIMRESSGMHLVDAKEFTDDVLKGRPRTFKIFDYEDINIVLNSLHIIDVDAEAASGDEVLTFEAWMEKKIGDYKWDRHEAFTNGRTHDFDIASIVVGHYEVILAEFRKRGK